MVEFSIGWDRANTLGMDSVFENDYGKGKRDVKIRKVKIVKSVIDCNAGNLSRPVGEGSALNTGSTGRERTISIMTRVRGVQRVAATTLVVVALTSCSGNGSNQAAPEPKPTGSVSTTATTPATPSEIAAESASALVRQYFATVDELSQDPTQSISKLKTVAMSTQLLAYETQIKSQRQSGQRQLGDLKIAQVQVESVSLDKPVTVLVNVCWDVSDVDVVDRAGKSVVSPNRKDSGWTRLTVTNQKWDTSPKDGWRVSGGSDLEKEPCEGE